MVLKTELKPTNADCEEFLNKLWTMRRLDDEYPPDEIRLKQLAKIYILANEDLGDPTGVHKFRVGHCYLLLNNFEVAYIYFNFSLETRLMILPKLDLRLAETYLETGLANLSRRWFDYLKLAHECILKAIEIYEQTSADDAHFAEAYRALALVCEKKGNLLEAIRLSKNVLEIFECDPPKNEFKLARIHGDFGRYLMKNGQYDESREHLQTAMTILEKLTPQGHMNIVIACRALAELHKVSGNLESAFQYAEKILQMLEEMYPKNIGEIGKTHAFIAELYELLGRKYSDISYLQKSIEISRIARQMMNTGLLPNKLRNFNLPDKLLKHMKEKNDNCLVLKPYDEAEKGILEILKDILPANVDYMEFFLINFPVSRIYTEAEKFSDPREVYLEFFSASQIYANMKKFDRAMYYAQEALDFYKKLFPSDEDKFLNTLNLNIRKIHDRINFDNS